MAAVLEIDNIDRRTKTSIRWLEKHLLSIGKGLVDFKTDKASQIDILVQCVSKSRSQRGMCLSRKELKYRMRRLSDFFGCNFHKSKFCYEFCAKMTFSGGASMRYKR